jgi:methanogen homocitrate synthase
MTALCGRVSSRPRSRTHRLQLSVDESVDDLRTLVAAAGRTDTEILILGFMPDWQAQIDRAVDAGVTYVNIACRSSDILLKLLGWSRDDFIRRSVETIAYAKAKGARVVYSPTDTTRATWETLREAYCEAVSAGAEMVYVLDTVGVASPAAMSFLVREVRATVHDVPVGVHTHNDLGLGLANALAGYEAGAQVVDTCVNGLGDRCGNPSLDEVVVTLELIYKTLTGINLSALTRVADEVAQISHVPVASNKPIVGDQAFAQKIDIHVRATLSDPLAYQGFSPELVGAKARIIVGKHTGPSGLGAKIADLGMAPLTQAEMQVALCHVSRAAERAKRSLTDEEVRGLVAGIRVG